MHLGAIKTRNDLIKLHFALPADEWIILVKPVDNNTAIREIILNMSLFSTKYVEWLRARNANGCHIYGRPNSTRFILIDDVEQEGIIRLKQDGLNPTAVIETSLDSFQVWIAVSSDELPIPIANQLAKLLERRYSTDIGSADALHLGRLPGLRNKKAKYRSDPNDGGPLVRLRLARTVPKIPDGISQLIDEAQRLAADRASASSSSAIGACAPTDIDPSRSRMTREEASEIYEAELRYQAMRKGWSLPIRKGLRSHADYAVVYGLRLQYGYESNDLAAVLTFESEKAAEGGADYVIRTVRAALRGQRSSTVIPRPACSGSV